MVGFEPTVCTFERDGNHAFSTKHRVVYSLWKTDINIVGIDEGEGEK